MLLPNPDLFLNVKSKGMSQDEGVGNYTLLLGR